MGMEVDTDAASDTVRTLRSRELACDACRRRKIRCDKLSPCSGCKATNIACQTTKKIEARRQTFRKEVQYERRLAELNHKVQQLSQGLDSKGMDHSRQSISKEDNSTPTVASPSSLPDYSRNGHSSFEGDSSFLVHSKQATQAFEASLASTPRAKGDETLNSAMVNMQKTLKSDSTHEICSAPSSSLVDRTEANALSVLPLPPVDEVLRLLKYIKGILTHQR